jgi:hypothetical protein
MDSYGSRVALRFKHSRKLSHGVFQERENDFETFQARSDHCMHPGLLAVQPHRTMATLSVEGESGLVRGEASSAPAWAMATG